MDDGRGLVGDGGWEMNGGRWMVGEEGWENGR